MAFAAQSIGLLLHLFSLVLIVRKRYCVGSDVFGVCGSICARVCVCVCVLDRFFTRVMCIQWGFVFCDLC